MAATNRGTRLAKLVSILKKKFKPTPPAERPLFESVLYACLLENSTHAAAEEAIRHLESSYFDWNEVRVSTRTELAKAFKPLNDPAEAADRLKRSLQSIFESVYMFDLESFKKQNLGQSVKQFTSYDGVTPFVVSYVTQNGLSGHSIALNKGALIAFHVLNLISDAELKKGVVPGLERAVPKNGAIEVGSIIHQLGVEIGRNPYSPNARKLLLSIDPNCKSRLPKRAPKPKPEPPRPKAKPAAKVAPSKVAPSKVAPSKEATSKEATSKETSAKKAPAKKTPAKKGGAKVAPTPAAKKSPAKAAKPVVKKKAVAKKPPTKKVVEKKVVKKKAATKAKATNKKPAKKKPAAKATTKKPATKKATTKKGAAKKVAKKKTAKKTAGSSKKKRKPR